MELAKAQGTTVILVGHVTKDGALAGPRVLEHLVDCVLQFEGERERPYRELRALKNRFGSTNEAGLFEMRQGGLVEVLDASARFVAEADAGAGQRRAGRRWRARGRCWSRCRRWSRPPSSSSRGASSRASTATGWRWCSRSSAATAASARAAADVFVNVVGGVRVDEPGCDLAVALAVASASRGVAARRGAPLACFGELGLTGELRWVGHPERRLAEAAGTAWSGVIAPAGQRRRAPARRRRCARRWRSPCPAGAGGRPAPLARPRVVRGSAFAGRTQALRSRFRQLLAVQLRDR